MKCSKKYKGNLPRLSHSPAEWALSSRPMTVCASARADAASNVPDRLELHVNGEDKYIMLPCDSIECDGIGYEIYSAVVPAEKVQGKEIKYLITEEGIDAEKCGAFTVRLEAPGALPVPPALVITEIYGRPKGHNATKYIEVMNPGTEDVDLYDYEFLVYAGASEPDGKPAGRLPMSDEKGRDILKPGDFAAVWGIKPLNFKAPLCIDTVDRFWKELAADFSYNAALNPADGRVVPVKYYEENPETGAKTLLPGVCDLPEKQSITTVAIVPRGGNNGDIIYHLTYSYAYAQWDTPVKRSSYWGIDPFNPSVGVNLSHRDFATPGYPGRGQATPKPDAALPLIIPVAPSEGIYAGDGACDICFAAVSADASRPAVGADVNVTLNGEKICIKAAEGDDGLWHAVLEEDYAVSAREFTYSVVCTDGTRSVSTAEIRVPVCDNRGPDITAILPTEKYAYISGEDMTVKASFSDISGVDTGKCALYIDGTDVTERAVWTASSVEYMPVKGQTAIGEHSLELVLRDYLGNRSEKKVNYSVADTADMNIYRGEVHCHTADSDGSELPADAIKYARDVGKADYFAVTEHSHYFTDEFYRKQVKLSDSCNAPGKFASIYGWEMTWNNQTGYWGHMNVLNSKEVLHNIHKVYMPDLYKWLGEHSEALAMFNHPGLTWGNFDEYAFRTPEADRQVCLAEIRGPAYDLEYSHMLSMGWHASPVCNEDNHQPNWTTATPYTGCVLAPELTRENVIDAFRARRTYTTSDSTLKLKFQINGRWLGSRLDNPEKLNVEINITTEKAAGIGLVELMGEDNIVVASKNAGVRKELSWKLKLSPDFDYYYVRITGQVEYCVSAPVWIENRRRAAITGIDYNASYNCEETAAVAVHINNPLEEKLTDARVAFYLSPRSGFTLGNAEPYATVFAGDIGAGKSIKVSRLLPEVPGNRRVSVIVSAKCGSGRAVSTSYIMTSPVQITAVLPDSGNLKREDGTTVKNAYCYAVLTNSSPLDVSLNGGRLLPWVTTGKVPPEGRIAATDGITVPARSSVVIWDRSQCPELTAEDFNRRFGTSLTEGKDLFPVSVHFLSGNTDGHRLDLSLNGELMSRVLWNWGTSCDRVKHPDTEYRYVYRTNMTGTSTCTGSGIPAPGKTDEEQNRAQYAVLTRRTEKKNEKKGVKKDAKAEERREKLAMTGIEATALAAGAAAAASAIATGIQVLFRKNKS